MLANCCNIKGIKHFRMCYFLENNQLHGGKSTQQPVTDCFPITVLFLI